MKAFKSLKTQLLAAGLLAAAAIASPAQAANSYGVYITEWMYQGAGDTNREFIEFTNTSTSAVDFSGWSYDDDSRSPMTFMLSSLGVVGAGESVIITEMSASAFRTAWNLDSSVKVLGGYTNNLGNGDEINLYDADENLVDRLTYGSNPRTRGVSGRATSFEALGANNVSQWVFSSVGDIENSYRSNLGDVGSPGYSSYTLAVPELDALAMMAFGVAAAGVVRRRQKAARG